MMTPDEKPWGRLLKEQEPAKKGPPLVSKLRKRYVVLGLVTVFGAYEYFTSHSKSAAQQAVPATEMVPMADQGRPDAKVEAALAEAIDIDKARNARLEECVQTMMGLKGFSAVDTIFDERNSRAFITLDMPGVWRTNVTSGTVYDGMEVRKRAGLGPNDKAFYAALDICVAYAFGGEPDAAVAAVKATKFDAKMFMKGFAPKPKP